MIPLALVLLVGCRLATSGANTISLKQDDEFAMKAEILQHVPLGTPVPQAMEIMDANGFNCQHLEADDIGPARLFCRNDVTESWPITRSWMVFFEYSHDVVTGVHVTTGLTGP